MPLLITDSGIDISKNIKAIERIKCEILKDTAALYTVLNDSDEDVYEDSTKALSKLIIDTCLLGKRLGIGPLALEGEVTNQLKYGILNEEDLEKEFKDYSELLHFLKGRNV